MNFRRVFLSLSLGIVFGVPLLAAAPDWTPTTRLDPRTPLEIGHPLPGVGGPGVVPIPVLYGTVPEFQLLQVDIRTLGPRVVRALTIDPDGSIFALGSTGETTNGTWGGVYIDDFHLRFWRSNSPHTTVENFPINTVQNWVDASSAAAGPAFFVSGVNFDTGSVEIFYSVTNGVFWNSLRSFAPPNPLYVNFEGGERVSFWVDPLATDPATTRNCFFYETRNGGLTTKWVNCADGATPVLNVPMISDVPNPFNQFDKYIENRGFALPGGRSAGIFTRRTDGREWLFDYDADGNLDLYDERPAPPDLEIPSFGWGDDFEATDRIRSVRPGGNNEISVDALFDLFAGTSTSGPGPKMDQGPVAMARERRTFWVFFANSEPGTEGLGASSSPLPMFADGFESGDTSAWSSTVP